MEERDSREGCWRLAEWSPLGWMRSRAQTAHCTTLFIFLKVEVLGFSPALMEVLYVGMCLTVKVWILHNVCAYVGILHIWVKGGREMKGKVSYVWIWKWWAQPCYPLLPYRHRKTPIRIFSPSNSLLFTNCDVASLLNLWKALWDTWEFFSVSIFCWLLRAKPTFVNLCVIYWSWIDLLKVQKNCLNLEWKKTIGMRDAYVVIAYVL